MDFISQAYVNLQMFTSSWCFIRIGPSKKMVEPDLHCYLGFSNYTFFLLVSNLFVHILFSRLNLGKGAVYRSFQTAFASQGSRVH